MTRMPSHSCLNAVVFAEVWVWAFCIPVYLFFFFLSLG